MPPCAMTVVVTQIPAHSIGFIKKPLQEQRNHLKKCPEGWLHTQDPWNYSKLGSSGASTCINHVHCSFTHLLLLLNSDALCCSFHFSSWFKL